MRSPPDQRSESRPRPARAARRLRTAAFLAAVFALVLSAAPTGLRLVRGQALDVSITLNGAAMLLAGIVFAAVLWGLAALHESAAQTASRIERVEERIAEFRSIRSSSASYSDSPPARAPSTPPTTLPPPSAPDDSVRSMLEELLVILRDVRDNTLLTDEERREKAGHFEQTELAEAEKLIGSFAERGEFEHARDRLDELDRRFRRRPAVARLREFVEQSRLHREQEEFAHIGRRVDELINMCAWDKAREEVALFRGRYPGCAGVDTFEARIEREFQIYDDAQRQRLNAEIQRYVLRRRWREALAAAEAFIERFPHRPESEALALQLETLRNNAEVSARQEMEAEITELAKRGQYAEAEALARIAIERWPDSTQAEILRSQLDRLHELATNPNAPPPRVRPSGPPLNFSQG